MLPIVACTLQGNLSIATEAAELRFTEQRRQQAEAELEAARQRAANAQQEQSRVQGELSAAKGQVRELQSEEEKLRKQLLEAEAR